MNILIDSWAWIEIFEGSQAGRTAIELIKDQKNVAFTTVLSIYEVWYRIKQKFDEEKARMAVATMKHYSALVPIDESVAIAAGNLKLSERIPAIDAFVLAVSLAINAYVVTGDTEHFKGRKNVILL